jgi:hypothetical protein
MDMNMGGKHLREIGLQGYREDEEEEKEVLVYYLMEGRRGGCLM